MTITKMTITKMTITTKMRKQTKMTSTTRKKTRMTSTKNSNETTDLTIPTTNQTTNWTSYSQAVVADLPQTTNCQSLSIATMTMNSCPAQSC